MALDTDSDFVRKLMLIRYMYLQADKYSLLSDRRAVISVLMFHDAVDLWLQIAAHGLGVKVGWKTYFTEYLDLIDRALREKSNQLINVFPMQQLNDARNTFKHKGVVPDAETIGSFRVNVRDFLRVNTSAVFGLEFEQLSLVDLLEEGLVKQLLLRARVAFKDDRIWNAAANAAVAFRVLTETSGLRTGDSSPDDLVEKLQESKLPGSPKIKTGAITEESIVAEANAWAYLEAHFGQHPSGKDASEVLEELDPERKATASELVPTLQRLGDRISRLEYAALLLEYGVNLRDYRRFMRSAPDEVELSSVYTYSDEDGGLEVDDEEPIDLGELTPEEVADYMEYTKEVQFMIDFVTDCALRVQGVEEEWVEPDFDERLGY